MIHFYLTSKFLSQTFEAKSTSFLPAKSALVKYAIKGASVHYTRLTDKEELLVQYVRLDNKLYCLLAATCSCPRWIYFSGYTNMYLQFALISGAATCTLWGLGNFNMKMQETRVAYLGAGEEHYVYLKAGEHVINLNTIDDKEIAAATNELEAFSFMQFRAQTHSRYSVQQVIESGLPSSYYTWLFSIDFGNLDKKNELEGHLRESFRQFLDWRSVELSRLHFDANKMEQARCVVEVMMANPQMNLTQIVKKCGLPDYEALSRLLFQLAGQTAKAFQNELLLVQLFALALSGEVTLIEACTKLLRSRSAVAKLFFSRFQISYSRLGKFR